MDYLIHHMLRSSAIRLPEKEALVHGNSRLTYSQVARQSANLAASLRKAGLRRGERVGIFLDPSVPQVLSIFAVCQAGGVFVPINQMLFPEQVGHIAHDCEMTAIITTRAKLASLEAVVQHSTTLRFVVVDDPIDVSCNGKKVYGFSEMSQSGSGSELSDQNIEKDLAGILYTSGSTGKPKGVMLSHAQIMAGSSIVSTYLDISENDRILAALPFSFDAGMNQLMTAFQQGGTVVLINFVFARDIVHALIKEEVTGLAGVPTLWNLLVQPNSGLSKNTIGQLRYITNTGGAMPQPVLATLRTLLPGTKVYLMYGLTEAFRSTYLPPEELDRRPTSMGKAIPNTEILVVNEQGQPCHPGEVGELVHRGPTVSMGYWGQPELTARVLRPNPFLSKELGEGDKVCYSGDMVKMDEDGFLYFVGRRDTMIKSSGFRISPTEVEESLYASGQLRGAAVIGVPDEILGQAIKAFVVPREGEAVDPQGLIAFCGGKLPRYMLPKYLEILHELPKTTSGKVDYPALRRKEGL
jgi:acyl-CoA ligase (AMP-forming) (exosortase A-associated)